MIHNRAPRAILFDLDDTIVTFGAVSRQAWETVCRQLSGGGAVFDAARFLESMHAVSRRYWSDPDRHRIGRLRLLETRRELVTEAFARLGMRNRGLCGAVADAYSAERDRLMAFFPGAEETLEALAHSDIRLALVTNGQSTLQRAKIDRFGLERFFPIICIEQEIGFGKPREEVYRLALKRLDTAPSDTWMVGDNPEWDVIAPQKLGIAGVWHDYRKKGVSDDTFRPDHTIHAIAELAYLAGEGA